MNPFPFQLTYEAVTQTSVREKAILVFVSANSWATVNSRRKDCSSTLFVLLPVVLLALRQRSLGRSAVRLSHFGQVANYVVDREPRSPIKHIEGETRIYTDIEVAPGSMVAIEWTNRLIHLEKDE